jgi:hypothetical protein
VFVLAVVVVDTVAEQKTFADAVGVAEAMKAEVFVAAEAVAVVIATVSVVVIEGALVAVVKVAEGKPYFVAE